MIKTYSDWLEKSMDMNPEDKRNLLLAASEKELLAELVMELERNTKDRWELQDVMEEMSFQLERIDREVENLKYVL